MAMPWEQYQTQAQAPSQDGPWNKYAGSGSGPWVKYGTAPQDSRGGLIDSMTSAMGQPLKDVENILENPGQFIKNLGGAALGAADIASSLITAIPTNVYNQAASALGYKTPEQAEKDINSEMAAMSPSAAVAYIANKTGLPDPRTNQSYEMMMKGAGAIPEAINEGVDALGGGAQARMAAQGIASVIPIPFLGKAGALAKRGLERFDPGLRDATPPKLPSEVVPPGGTLEKSTAPNGDTVQWVEEPPNPQLDFHQPINPYDVGGHVTALQEGRATTIDASQPELGGRVENTSAVPAEVAAADNAQRTQEFTQNATQGELFNDQPMNMHRAYDQFGPDELPRALTREEFESTVDALAKEPGTTFHKPDDMDAAYNSYLQDMEGKQGGLFDRPSQQQGFANTLGDEVTARVRQNFNQDSRWQALKQQVTDLTVRKGQATNKSVQTKLQNQIDTVKSQMVELEDAYKNLDIQFGQGNYSPADIYDRPLTLPANPEITQGNVTAGPPAEPGHYVPPDAPQPFMEASKGIPGLTEWTGSDVGNKPSVGAPRASEAPLANQPSMATHAEGEPIVQAMDSIPGLSKEGKKMVVESRTPEQIIQLARNEGRDGSPSLLKRLFYSGATFAGEMRDSFLIRGVRDYMNTAHNMATKAINEVVVPIEKKLVYLGNRDRQMLASLLKEESFAKSHLGEGERQQLFAQGRNPERLEDAYQHFRRAQDEAYTRLNVGRAAAGLDPVEYRQAYIASMWRGNWKSAAYLDGKLIGFLRDSTSRGLAKQKAALIEHFKDKGEEVQGIEWRDHKAQSNFEPSDTLQASFLEALKFLDTDDPIVQEFVKAQEAQLAEQAYGAHGVSKHTETKYGIRGFIGDRFDKTPQKNANDLLSAQMRYMKNVITWSEQQKGVAKAKQVLSDPDLKLQQPNNIQYATEYVKNALGFGTNKEIRSLETSLARNMGLDRESLVSAMQFTKSYFYLKQLGLLNPKATLVQFPQVFFMLPAHAELASKGFKYDAGTTSLNTLKDYTNILTKGKLGGMSEIGKQAIEFAKDRGILSINILDDVKNVGDSFLHRKAAKYANINQVKIEQFGRTISYLSMVHHLHESGLRGEALFKTAEAITDRVMVDYRKFEQPMWMERGGITTKAMGTLKNFTNNQFNQFAYYFQQAKKGYIKPLMTMVAIQYALGGILGMPGAQTLMDGYDSISKHLDPSAAGKSMKTWMLENLDKAQLYGGFSALTGVNMFSSLGQGYIAGSDDLAGFFAPFLEDSVKTAMATGKALLDPTNSEKWQTALYENLPPQGKGIMENVDPHLTSPNGVSLSPRNPENGTYKRDQFDRALRYLGATSLKEFSTKEKSYAARQQEQDISQAKGEMRNSYIAGARQGNPVMQQKAVKALSQWMGPGELFNYLQEGLKKSQRDRLLTTIQKLYPTSLNKVSDFQKVNRINGLVK